MNLEKNLKNFGRCVLGTILATSLFLSCDNGTTSNKNDDEEPQQEIYGAVAGRIVAPRIENNQIVWFGQDNAIIKLDETLKTTSSADGQFRLDNVSAGNRNLIARYYVNGNTYGTITHKSDPLSIPIYENMLTTINVDIKLNPYISNEHILHGIIYNKDKMTTYNGTLNINRPRTGGGETYPGDVTDSTFVSRGLYAFKGSNDRRFLTTGDGTNRIIKLLPTENVPNEHSLIVFDYDGITEQNGYVTDETF